MRSYVLTEVEREIIKRYLKDGTHLDGWTTLKWRVEQFFPRLEEDMELVKGFIEKLTPTPSNEDE